MNKVSIERLHELFILTKDGKLVRKIRMSRCMPGSIVGCPDQRGYLRVSVDGHRMRVHRLVFAMTHGRWPNEFVDHINGHTDDNRPENLREADSSENQWNRCIQKNNISGYKGVHKDSRSGKWRAVITIRKKQLYLGTFEDAEQANIAYQSIARYHHGEFSCAKRRGNGEW